MATIGHTLVGMAISTVPFRPLNKSRAAWWPGTLVLAANFLDTGEWIAAMTWARWGTWHMMHGWLPATGIAGGGSLLLWLPGRVKRIGPHLLLWIAVMSHLPMDGYGLNREIRRWYRDPPPMAAIDAKAVNLPAETWFYGILPVAGLLITVAARNDLSIGVRRTAILLLLATLPAFFVPFVRPLWMTMYAVDILYALIALRPRVRLSWMINGVFVAPILILAGVEIWSMNLIRLGDEQAALGQSEDAINTFQQATRLPTRTDKTYIWWRIGREQERLGRFVEAEKSYTRCKELDREWQWSELELGDFYLRRYGKNDLRIEALYREAIEKRPPEIQRSAEARLKALRSRP